MPDMLKGNFNVPNNVEPKKIEDDGLEGQFEREAMKKLGGSVAFVSKKKIKWAKNKQK